MMSLALITALVSLGIWIKLIVAQGGFWRERPLDKASVPRQGIETWPNVVAVVPARNEADVIATSISNLLSQNYPGHFEIILVDDQSTDGTAEIARHAADDAGDRLTILSGAALPPGWVGKMWAVAQGVAEARKRVPDLTYIWLTDADIGHRPDNLRLLVARAEAGDLDLTSQMVRLDTSSAGEKFLIPAFVYFFAMLYPFAWVNDRTKPVAAAAGGSMLVRASALEQTGGIEAIRDALIDDCALARQIKSQIQPRGGVHLSLTDNAHSLRSYGGFLGVSRMVARSAYCQLDYSPLALVGTVIGMAFVFLVPLYLVFQGGAAGVVSVVTYGLMVLSFGPILETYRLSPLYALSLPLTALCYLGFTVQSAINHYRGRGGYWKGRVQAGAAGSDSLGESGKNASTENFPVASWLIAPAYRSAIHAFYRFARAADDVADDPRMSAADKLARLDALAAALVPMGQERLGGDLAIEAQRHQVTLAHAHDLLDAFRLDVTKTRYKDWDDLMAYCQKSAMPVGRFVLDVHGEDPATHGRSDALCAALQVINHLQDCGDDLREIDRVYIPEPYLHAQGETIEALRRGQCSAGLRRVIDDLLDRTGALLVQSSALAPMVKDWRLRLEIAIIQTVAERLVGELRRRDPLSERVKLSRQDYALCALQGVLRGFQAAGINR